MKKGTRCIPAPGKHRVPFSAHPTDIPGKVGGGGRIRTRERLAPLTVFKTVAFVHSATPPGSVNLCWQTPRSHAQDHGHTSSSTSSATKIGASRRTAKAMASLGRESTSNVCPFWLMISRA